MNRTFLALAVCAAVGIGGMALARHDEKDTAKVTDRLPVGRLSISV